MSAKADVYAAGWVFFEVLCGLSVLLFREADTDDDFAASKLTAVAAALLAERMSDQICE